MNRRDAIRRVGAVGAALALPAWAQTNRLVLGQSAALSGPTAQLGIQMHRGAKVSFDQLNASGGVNGQTIALRTLDDGYEPDRCKSNTEKLIADDVFALFGYVGTPTCVAALPLVNEAQIPFFGPFTGAEVLRDPFSRSVFHLRASYYDETALIVKQLTSLGRNRAEDARCGGADQRLQVLRGVHPRSAQAGYGGIFYNVSFVGTQALADELGRAARGIIISQVMPFPFSTTLPISREYLDAVGRAGPDTTPNYSSMEGWLAAKVSSEGLRRAGRNLSREALSTALESIQNANFGGFRVDFGAKDHVASSFVELSMLTGDGKVRR